MQITVGPDIEEIIGHGIRSGQFATAEEVVAAGVLSLFESNDPEVEKRRMALIESLDKASAQIARGEGYKYTATEFIERAQVLRSAATAK